MEFLNAIQEQLPIHDPVLIFAVVMLIILLAPLLIERLKIPGLVGTILAGALVGPNGLGLLENDSTIDLLGTVGLLYLMFTAGLSIDLNQFDKNRNKSIIFGLISFFVPQLAAIPVGLYLLDFSLPASILLGSIVGSHTLLAYPIVNRLGIDKQASITMAMGGTIVTDTLSLLILAVVSNAVAGTASAWFWGIFAASVAAYTIAMLFGLPRLARWFFRNIEHQPNTHYIFMIAVLFVAAYVADLAGLAPIIGAFLGGLTLNRLVPQSSTLMSRVQFVGNVFFVPFFLISVGMLVDFGVMTESLNVWLQIITFSLLVVVGKTLAAKMTQWTYGFSANEGWTMAGLSIPQAAATLAVTLVAYDMELLSQNSVNAVVILILISCILGPFMVEKFGRKLALDQKQKPYNHDEAPERILVPLANPETAEFLMSIAMMIRRKQSGEPLFPLSVTRAVDNAEAKVAESEDLLSHAVMHASAGEVPTSPVTRVDMDITKGILRAVQELRISHIVIGWNGQINTRERVFGTVLDELLQKARQHLIVAKVEFPLNTTQRIFLLIPPLIDREPGFKAALRNTKIMASEIGADLVVVCSQNNNETIRKQVRKEEPELEANFIILENWKYLLSDERLYFREGEDLVLLMSIRKGSLSWDRKLERLPRILVQNYPGVNFIALYPSELSRAEDQPEIVHLDDISAAPYIKNEHTNLELEDMSLEDAFRQMLYKTFDEDPPEMKRVIRDLMRFENGDASQQVDGSLLARARTRKVEKPTLFLGISHKGLKNPDSGADIFIIFVLLAPVAGTSAASGQQQLRILSELSRLLHQRELLERLKKADSPADINAIIASKKQE